MKVIILRKIRWLSFRAISQGLRNIQKSWKWLGFIVSLLSLTLPREESLNQRNSALVLLINSTTVTDRTSTAHRERPEQPYNCTVITGTTLSRPTSLEPTHHLQTAYSLAALPREPWHSFLYLFRPHSIYSLSPSFFLFLA